MLDESNPSTTPEKSGNDKSAANKSNDDGKNHPKNEIKPRKRQSQKWFGLTKSKWREFFGYAILIPWLWYDLIDSHGFIKLCFLAVSLVIGQGIACSFLNSRSKALSFWLASIFPVVVMVWANSKPEIKPHPHFKFSTFTDDNFDGRLELTNDFLFLPHGVNGFIFKGILCVPVQTGQTNIAFNISIKNDSEVTAENPEMCVSVSSNLMCVPADGWKNVLGMSVACVDSSMKSWGYPFRTILSGNGQIAPSLKLKILDGDDVGKLYFIMRAKDSPPETVAFCVLFSKNNLVKKPLVALSTTNSFGGREIIIPVIPAN